VRNTLEELGAAAEKQAQERPSQILRAVEGLASEKHAKALLDYANRESALIQNEFARRTSDAKIRQEEAMATKQEADAELAQLNLLEAKSRFVQTVGMPVPSFSRPTPMETSLSERRVRMKSLRSMR
jgi:hypothetical protein